MTNPDIARLRELLSTLNAVSMTTLDDRYRPVSRPMVLLANEFDGVLHFLAPTDSRVITHLAGTSSINISHTSPGSALSLTGTADFTTDAESVERHWDELLRPWFPTGPVGNALITVTVDEARFWSMREAASIDAPSAESVEPAGADRE